jgi:CheY-like chemotaxis protein/anti-sigma regulatory factor (Ser/Thr protein kinase)
VEAERAPVRVLLVDDAPEARRLVRTALRFRGGFEIAGEASTGTAAITLVDEVEPDVVVLDLGLPDITGRDVLSRMREQHPGLRVVIFSGAEPEDRAWYDEHAQGYVLKDADIDYLVELLESVARPPDEPEVLLDLPQDLGSVRTARRFVRETLSQWGLVGIVDDALLVVSELAANAITHAGSDYQVRLTSTARSIRIEVRDGGEGTPEPQPKSLTSERGRGLLMVAAISASWGIERSEGRRKLVWAELTRP